MHDYRVTFMPFSAEGLTTGRTITAKTWRADSEWIDFLAEDGSVTHRVFAGSVLSLEVLPGKVTGADIAAEALAQMPGEPYPLDEPQAGDTLICAHGMGMLTFCGKVVTDPGVSVGTEGVRVTCGACLAVPGRVDGEARPDPSVVVNYHGNGPAPEQQEHSTASSRSGSPSWPSQAS